MALRPPQDAATQDLLANCKQEVDAVIFEKDKDVGGDVRADRREHDRLQYQIAGGVRFVVQHPGGSDACFRVYPYNLSNTGVGFIHGAFVYPGSKCLVELRMPNGKSQWTPAKVARCIHVTKRIHDVGIRFDEVMKHGWYDSSAEPEEPAEIDASLPTCTGSVLVFTPSKAERDLIQYMLGKLQLEVATATKVSDAQRYVDQKLFNLILVAVWEGEEGSGLELVKALRAANCPTPIVGICTNGTDEDRERALAAGCADVIKSLSDMDGLIRVAEQFTVCKINASSKVEPLKSTRWADIQLRPMILHFLNHLEQQIQVLQRLLATDDKKEVLKICRDLRVTAAGYGYEPISDAVAELQQLVIAETEVAAMQESVAQLTTLMTRACQMRS